ncbi:hypothetical protein [Virgisporangium aurantiacum]|uniref:DUF11 domain-containing protein n=1 Tax=Virgisporangium aurantiacum TaxID=175570 RepID=A0A8J3ZEI1_9ACTN|nr:hypothetical protein [Virgisporangium aurantiacum]GIJ60330.1 hypothetical protein Vau01_078460 [Virgisporangium aurantiacum]
MSMRLPRRPARAAAVAFAALVTLTLTVVTVRAEAAAAPRGDLDLTAGPFEHMYAYGSSVTVSHTFFTRNDGPDDMPAFRVTVAATGAGQINILDAGASGGTVCRAEDTCEMTISAAIPEDTGRQFEVRLSAPPGTAYSVTVGAGPGATDPRTRDNTVTGTQPWPSTDLALAVDSNEVIWRNGNNVGVEYRFTLTNNGPQQLTELDIDVETDAATEIRIEGPDDQPNHVCRAVTACNIRYTDAVYTPGTTLPLTITVFGPARTDGEVKVAAPWSVDPTPQPRVVFRLPDPRGRI